jgi:uncharacterized repeat protein (TIGR01451 family)
MSKVGFVFLLCLGLTGWGAMDSPKITVGNTSKGGDNIAPYFFGDFDAAGYSDWIWYGQSPEHPHGYHEVLSGEWGAAIYYDGIETAPRDPNTPQDRQAMWLTRRFEYPYWNTNSTFFTAGNCIAWNDPNNPLTGMADAGVSFIRNEKVEIRIDYEVVDLEAVDANFYPTRSPMTYLDPDTGDTQYVNSDRYCFLQTYTIRNIDPNNSPITSLAFYQQLHSHGANDYGPHVNSTYSTVALSDALEGYQPYNPRHQVGNFRYDITQWNSTEQSSTTHTDFVNFSSTREPDWIDHDIFRGHSDRPSQGGHINVEQRQLNGLPFIYLDEVAGTMGWSLGTLEPNATASITVAYMVGMLHEPNSLIVLSKEDDIESGCVQPGDSITYTLSWVNNSAEWATGAVLTDHLPAGVTYPQGMWTLNPNDLFHPIPPDISYSTQHTYSWLLGDIEPYGTGSVTLTVTVNEMAEPGLPLRNQAKLTSSLGTARADEFTPVCCWGNDVIYVDDDARGNNTGTSWANAYTDLQSALVRVAAGCTTEIRVAQGMYDPGRAAATTFTIPDGVSVYGGYRGGTINPNERNPKRYVSTLSGLWDSDERNETIVTMGDNSLLEGFTVTDAALYGVYGSDVAFAIENCTVKNNDGYGIYALNRNVTVRWCKISSNRYFGIRHEGEGFTLTVENSWIMRNGRYGIYCLNSTPTVKNSIVSESSLSEVGYEGIRIINPTDTPVLHNNTIANNKAEGIFFVSNNDPNNIIVPDLQNCIIYYNNNNGSQLAGINADIAAYFCCIQDCNEVNTTNFSFEPGFAYTVDPNGVPDPNNYHLSAISECIDRGNPFLICTAQVDIDGEGLNRKYGEEVDVGADEVYNCDDGHVSEADVHNTLDSDADGLVNLKEFVKFSAAWLSHNPTDPAWLADPNLADPNLSEPWNPVCNLADTGSSEYAIDLADLGVFLDDWLWVACWKLEEINTVMQVQRPMVESYAVEVTLSAGSTETMLQSVEAYPNISAETLVQIIGFVNDILAEQSDNLENIEELKSVLVQQLTAVLNREHQ